MGNRHLQEEETWYACDHGRLQAVLSFPETGESAAPLTFAWKTKAAPRRFDGSMDIVDIDYGVRVGTTLGLGIEGEFHHTVSFSKRTSSLRFQFNPAFQESGNPNSYPFMRLEIFRGNGGPNSFG